LGDVAVAPKLSATEGSGKILNYMAMSLPTVTFDTPVSYEYLGELGVYAESGNPKALAGAISSLLDDEERAIELGMKLRKKAVEAYSWEGAVERIVGIYSEICG
jgi:glycosyltransferase involved in cell wall biosynthesis